jgi:hypothetical protein
MMRAAFLCLWAAFALVVSMPTAQAYDFTYGYGWNETVKWNLHQSGSSGSLSSSDLEDILEDSIDAWGDPTCSDFANSYQGTSSSNSQSHGDGNNIVNFISSWPSSYGSANGTIGITMSMANGYELTEFDMNFNEQTYTFVDGQPGSGHQVDLQSVGTHEFGHAVGLDHSGSSSATMYASYDNGTGQRTLSQDDINGVCALYPSGKTDNNDDDDDDDDESCAICDTCTTGADCPPDDLCVDFDIGRSICTAWCDEASCPGDSECYVVSGAGGVEYQLCLNPNANEDGVCPDEYECTEESGSSGGTDDTDDGSGDNSSDSADTGRPPREAPEGDDPTKNCGCSALSPAGFGFPLLLGLVGLAARRRR